MRIEKELNCELQKIGCACQEELRKKIVRQMKKHGDAKEVAQICECTVRHVNKTWKKYQEGGINAIKAVKMGRPKGLCKRLTPQQEVSIKKQVINKTPEEVGLNGYLWGRAEVCELIKQQYGINMPLTTMGRYLARWNFTYQRPKKRLSTRRKSRKTVAFSDIS